MFELWSKNIGQIESLGRLVPIRAEIWLEQPCVGGRRDEGGPFMMMFIVVWVGITVTASLVA